MFLIDQRVLFQTTSATINTISWSDHASIVLSIADLASSKQKPMWRLNPFLLQQEEHRMTIQTRLREFFTLNEGSVQDPFILWNVHKAYMRGILIQLGAKAKRQRQKRLAELTENISILEAQNKNITTPTLSKQRSQLRQDLRLMLLDNFEKSSRRLKINYYVHGNRAGKLLVQNLKGHTVDIELKYLL